jgi:hypothetical protein
MHKPRSAAQTQVDQRQSTMSSDGDDPQLPLLETRKTCPPVDRAYLLALPNLRRAIRYSVSLADLEPKQVYDPLGMDKAIWSRIENGSMSFPADDLAKLALITGNDAPLMWLANARGYDLRPQRTELEEQLEAEKAHNAELQRQNDLMRELLTGRK